jgi:mRNA guanylyltransferase
MAEPDELMQRIGGLWAGQELQRTFQREVADLLGRDNLNFPGAQPVSFAARHISELKAKDYWVCEKTDGLRYLMYCTKDGPQDIHYLIDRKNNYYYKALTDSIQRQFLMAS